MTNPTDGVVVHGDAHLNNVIWNDTLLVALLDYGWARLGPPDLELQPLLLSADAAALIPSVVDVSPGIAAHPRVVERLWLYDLSATLRDLLVKAPLPADGDLPSWHPKRRLAMSSRDLAISMRCSAGRNDPAGDRRVGRYDLPHEARPQDTTSRVTKRQI